MSETDRLKLPKIAGNMTADVVRDLNALADKIDETVASQEDLGNVDRKVNEHSADYNQHVDNEEIHVTEAKQESWNNKADRTEVVIKDSMSFTIPMGTPARWYRIARNAGNIYGEFRIYENTPGARNIVNLIVGGSYGRSFNITCFHHAFYIKRMEKARIVQDGSFYYLEMLIGSATNYDHNIIVDSLYRNESWKMDLQNGEVSTSGTVIYETEIVPVRTTHVSTSAPSSSDGENGDIWYRYG